MKIYVNPFYCILTLLVNFSVLAVESIKIDISKFRTYSIGNLKNSFGDIAIEELGVWFHDEARPVHGSNFLYDHSAVVLLANPPKEWNLPKKTLLVSGVSLTGEPLINFATAALGTEPLSFYNSTTLLGGVKQNISRSDLEQFITEIKTLFPTADFADDLLIKRSTIAIRFKTESDLVRAYALLINKSYIEYLEFAPDRYIDRTTSNPKFLGNGKEPLIFDIRKLTRIRNKLTKKGARFMSEISLPVNCDALLDK